LKLWPVEHILNTFFTIFVIKIRSYSNQNIGEGETNFDDKYVEKSVQQVFNKCSTSVQLVRVSSFRNDLLQNPYFSEVTAKLLLTAAFWKIITALKNHMIWFEPIFMTKLELRLFNWQTTNAQREFSLHCTADNSLSHPNF
jgi:hypothetical protein